MVFAAALPFVGKLIPKVVGKVWLPVVELILLAAGAGMAFYTEVWMFIAAGALIGVCFAFTTGVAMSDVIDQWFKKSGGLAIGLAWAVNSIYMLIMSPSSPLSSRPLAGGLAIWCSLASPPCSFSPLPS